MIQYVLAGLVLGSIYAIAAAGLVITYESTGILNFAFGSFAYFIARFYYYLIVQKGWSILPAAVVAIVLAAPALGIGALVLRYTDVGLRVRALVDSEAMTALSGTNPGAISAGVWAVSTFFAGLAGVLAAPVIGLQPGNFTLLIASAFAAVIAAKLRSLPIAVAVGLAIGVTGALVERYMPAGSSLTTAVIPSIPFAFILVFLVFHARRGRVSETEGVGGALDRAILPHGGSASAL